MDRPARGNRAKACRKPAGNVQVFGAEPCAPARLLIVDGEAGYGESLSDGYRVITVETGRAAIERVRLRADIDLAVVEYRLSDMSGIDVLKEIKDVEPSVLVLIVTAYGDEDVAVEAFRSGARDYLKKPFSISELCTKVDFYLALRHADKKSRKNIVPESGQQVLSEGQPPSVTPSQYHKIQQAVRFINDNYRSDIRLDAVAAAAGMSPSHFSRTFRKVMGLSYQEYLNDRRITKAKNLLRTSPQSIAEIAVSLGFADPTGFGRIFKKLTDQTPSAYRSLPR